MFGGTKWVIGHVGYKRPLVPQGTARTHPYCTYVSTCEVAQIICYLQESPAAVGMLGTGEIWHCFLVASHRA